MDKTRGYQASIDYLMPIVTHPVMTGEYCRHLRNSIDAMIKFERIQSELERLNAENALLRKVVEAARETYLLCVNVGDFSNGVSCYGIDEGEEMARKVFNKLSQALAELDKEGER
ncbi:MAG: hypothetical protein PHG75_05230 [Syntrophomonas sp.]|nr:hypothetical protein [Syntrophomonas sp.]